MKIGRKREQRRKCQIKEMKTTTTIMTTMAWNIELSKAPSVGENIATLTLYFELILI